MRLQPTVFGCGGVPMLNSTESRACRFQSPSTRKVGYSSFHHLHCRRYASIPTDHPPPELSWPKTSSFTPYDLFCQERTAPYSKQRYYELVKVYHPDRSNDHDILKNISEEVRLRRYRLIVAAHEILSDPAKRAAYDRDGTGWHSHPDHPDSKIYSQTYGYSADMDGSIFQNATWEDWERYYNRHQPKQVQVVSHRTFVTFILLLVAFGGFAQASWITQYQTSFDHRIQEMNEKSARLLAGRRQQSDNLRSTEKRVQNFLIRRDPTGFGLKKEEGDVYKQALEPQRQAFPEQQLHDVPKQVSNYTALEKQT